MNVTLRNKMRARMDEVRAQVAEQDARYQDMRRNLEAYLKAGQDTSALVTEMEQYRKALSALHSGEPCMITKGKIPDSHICFLDEIFKASDGILNALLTALNERRYTNEGKTIDIPTISFFSASNEIPNFASPEERTIIQGTLERMCNDPLKDRLDGILASALECREDFDSSADAPPARRIGKLRDEFLRLYEQISQLSAAAQNDGEKQKIQACLDELEKQSQQAHAAIHFSYAPLSELYDLKAS